jgi:hypothetical protein
MPIKSNLKSLVPRRQQYKREIELLSHGYNDQTAWPGGKLTVYPWDDATDRWMIENVRKLNKQDLVYGLLRICCDLNGGNIDNFVADEINVVLMVSRALTTDGVVVYNATCPQCGAKKQEEIKVPDQLGKIGEKTADYVGYDEITLPMVRDKVKLRPLLVKDEKTIIGRKDADKKALSDAELRTIMRVVSIGDGNPETLDELVQWYRALHAKDSRFLEDEGRRITPHLDTNIPHICDEPDCGHKFIQSLTIDQEFFR